MSKSSFEDTSIGQILNIISNDLQRFFDICYSLAYVAIAPIQSIIAMYILWQYLGLACLGAIVILILFIPFQGFMGKKAEEFRFKTTRLTDSRVKLMGEIITAMKVIKMYCWEKPFAESVNEIRKKEVTRLKWTAFLESCNWSLCFTSCRAMYFASFIIHVFLGGSLDAETVFVTMSMLSVISKPLTLDLPHAVGLMGECMVTCSRITDILTLPEKSSSFSSSSSMSSYKTGTIVFDNYCGKWNHKVEKDSLIDINVEITPSDLLIVIGSVGSGKTCLLYSILTEIEMTSGQLYCSGQISYCPQESWCFGGSVRDNILLGEKMDHNKYSEVIKVCGLERDLQMFPSGDRTFVGEKGYTLSGGQKARVTLARAIYRDADIYLLDDPLSAVDPQVANHIFDKCIKGYLRDKTVVLVTHQLQFLPKADQILVLDEGKNIKTGTYEEVTNSDIDLLTIMTSKNVESKETPAKEPSLVKRVLSTHRSRNKSIGNGSGHDGADEERMRSKSGSFRSENWADGDEDREETMASGSVGSRVYWEYFRSGASVFFILFVAAVSTASQVTFNYTDYWLSGWTEKYTPDINGTYPTADITSERDNVLIYTGLTALLFFFYFGRIMSSYFLCLNCSIALQNKIFKALVRARMSFFENNPIGRILNRFTKDIGTIDQFIPYVVIDLNICIIESLGLVILTAVISPWLMLPAIALGLMSWPVRNIYLRTGRDVKRLEAVVRSPCYSHINATFDGLTTVRAFGLESKFESQYYVLMKDSASTQFLSMAANAGTAFLLDLFSNFYIAAISIFVITANHGLPGGMIGLILTNSTYLIGMFQWGVQCTAQFETMMVSVERVIEYGRLEPEPPFTLDGDEDDEMDIKEKRVNVALKCIKGVTRDWLKTWPSKGIIEFKNVNLSYGEENTSKKVLHDICFSVESSMKIGIAGRTGAGKSSLISVLFRLTEFEGQILIDGIDSKTLGLHELRNKISIIPQDPVLFSGSVRRNLDPFTQHDDEKFYGHV